uniref:30S ribosomal protein S6 n=1 Tax=Collinsella stercoris TaxID=147206 RepID=UPI003AEF5253
AIDKLTEGDYTLINFHADPASIAELDRVLRITDAVIRHMIVRRDDQEEVICMDAAPHSPRER